jgi:hypothetical protein
MLMMMMQLIISSGSEFPGRHWTAIGGCDSVELYYGTCMPACRKKQATQLRQSGKADRQSRR